MNDHAYHHLYGPVPSRRLGRSLGIDLVPFKVCNYDCVYCQLGRTTEKTMVRKAYISSDKVLAELERKLKEPDRPDYITLAGSGEPTLNAEIGLVVEGIKSMTDIPVAVLTNGSLLWQDEVMAALNAADVVIPSLDAGDEFLFRYVNRPCNDLSFDRMVTGLGKFVQTFKGEVWLEVMLLAGVTGLPGEVKKIAECVRACGISAVQLNTVVRPPAEDFACPLAKEQMCELAGYFAGGVESIGEHAPAMETCAAVNVETDGAIIALLNRRPCTVQGIAAGLSLLPNEVLKRLQPLAAQGKVQAVRKNNALFYEAVR